MKNSDDYLGVKLLPRRAGKLIEKHKRFSWLVFDFEGMLRTEKITQSRFRELVRMAVNDYVFDKTKEIEYKLIQSESQLKDYEDFFEGEEEMKEEFEEWQREIAMSKN